MKTTRRHVLKMAAAGVLAGPFHRLTLDRVFAGEPDGSTLDMVERLDLAGMNLLGGCRR